VRRLAFGKASEIAEDRSLPAAKAFSSSCKNSRRNRPREHPHGRKKRDDKATSGCRQVRARAGNDAMDVRMMLQVWPQV